MGFNWTPSTKFCATSAHVGWAAALFLAVLPSLPDQNVCFGLGCGDACLKLIPLTWNWCFIYVVIGFLLFVVLKEYWADLTWLEHDSIEGSTLDALSYVTGMGIGTLAYFHLIPGFLTAIGVLILMAYLDSETDFFFSFDLESRL